MGTSSNPIARITTRLQTARKPGSVARTWSATSSTRQDLALASNMRR